MTAPIRDILLDADGNRLLVDADYGFAEGIQGVKQGIECRVKMFLGEYWLDESIGVPYFQSVLIKNPSPIVVKSVIGRPIAETPDVTNVVNVLYEANSVTRAARVAYTCESTAGAIEGTITP